MEIDKLEKANKLQKRIKKQKEYLEKVTTFQGKYLQSLKEGRKKSDFTHWISTNFGSESTNRVDIKYIDLNEMIDTSVIRAERILKKLQKELDEL